MKGAWVGITLVAGAVAQAAGPGSLDPGFSPELRAPAVPEWTVVGPDGRSWVAGGFDRADGALKGDLLVLGENGGISSEPAPGYLSKPGSFFPLGFPAGRAPLPLASGAFLLPANSSGWLRVNADGTPAGPAFPGLAAGESLIPKSERDGKLWVIRMHANGSSSLERRLSADGSVDPEFSQGTDLPDDVLDTAPAALGGAWVLTGDHSTSSGFPLVNAPADQHLFLVHGSGAIAGEMRVLSGYRPATLAPRADGGVILVLGGDRSGWLYWPAPDSVTHTLEWRSPEGEVERSKSFNTPLFQPFVWAEGGDGSLVVTGADGDLIRFDAAGTRDESFHSPGKVFHVSALPDGKWLVDGIRRLNADGSDDATWTVPDLDRPAQLKLLEELPDGRVLAAGDFDEVDGASKAGLALFKVDGSLDTTFTVDERVGVVHSAKATEEGIYLATQTPVQVRDDLRSNLVRLHFDGSLDETFTPAWSVGSGGFLSPEMVTIDGAVQLDALVGGDLMVTSYGGYEVPSSNVSRVRPDGSKAPGFGVNPLYSGPEELVPLATGGFAKGGVFHEEDGEVARDLRRDGFKLDPLEEWQGGVLFFDKPDDSADGRLRLWKGKRWVSAFTSQRTTGAPLAEAGERKQLYLAAAFNDGDQALRRLTPAGKLDRTFRSARYTRQLRRKAGSWWIAAESGKQAYDPAANAEPAFLTALLWHAGSGRLWVAGDFNMIDGQPRDGMAWVSGGKKAPNPRR